MKRILIIDSNKNFFETVKCINDMCLEKSYIKNIKNINDGINILKNEKYDLIITEFFLKSLNEELFDFVKRETESTLVLLTSESDNIKVKCDYSFRKPFGKENILKLINGRYDELQQCSIKIYNHSIDESIKASSF